MTELQKQQSQAVLAHVEAQGDLPYRGMTHLTAFGVEETLSTLKTIYKDVLDEAYPQYESFVDLLDSPKIKYNEVEGEDDVVHDKMLYIRIFNMIE